MFFIVKINYLLIKKQRILLCINLITQTHRWTMIHWKQNLYFDSIGSRSYNYLLWINPLNPYVSLFFMHVLYTMRIGIQHVFNQVISRVLFIVEGIKRTEILHGSESLNGEAVIRLIPEPVNQIKETNRYSLYKYNKTQFFILILKPSL